MPSTIGPVGQMSLHQFAFRVTCPDLTARQFASIVGHLETIGSDTYADIDRRTCLFAFELGDCGIDYPDEMHGLVEEEVVDKFVRRCCDPKSHLFIPELADDSPATDAELLAITFPE